ncbi:MAG TPA: hypothetical protein VFG19_07660 [Geobacteraceae bacterium]|nr:hypothetical protein [Geobacteraceae bacterium]
MKVLVLIVLFMGISACAWGGGMGGAVEVEVVSDSGMSLPLYPVSDRACSRRAYAEATKGDHYSIVVRNRLNRRVGVVVAVDGRNIISGKKSWLKNGERMYVLEPYGEGEFKGWRTGMDTINRFFFTDAADSYAAAFNDESAMGVIAVAAYPEVERFRAYDELSMSKRKSVGKAAPTARSEEAGTGFGREEYSPVRVVDFEPEGRAAEKIFIKYEWRSTLCRRGIVSCVRPGPPRNRMWDDDGFAPSPPGWH